jgi:hypothetical protein
MRKRSRFPMNHFRTLANAHDRGVARRAGRIFSCEYVGHDVTFEATVIVVALP